jgi:hypothetical protein
MSPFITMKVVPPRETISNRSGESPSSHDVHDVSLGVVDGPDESAGLSGGTPTGLVTNRLGVGSFSVSASHLAWFDLLDPETDLVMDR